jgi:hypothetical protein
MFRRRLLVSSVPAELCDRQEKISSDGARTTIETAKLERYTIIVATIGNTAVYIGLSNGQDHQSVP